MKHMKRLFFSLIALLAITSAFSAMAAETAQAAVKNGLVKKAVKDEYTDETIGYKYYFYKDGAKVKNTWKSIKVKGKKHKFYFGKTGMACKAKDTWDKSYNVKVFKIKGKKYGFDADSHLVAKGIYVDENAKLFAFKKGGVYNKKLTNQLRSQFKRYDLGGKRSTELYNEAIAAFGKPLSEVKLSPCASWDGLPFSEFSAIDLNYRYFKIQLLLRNQTGEYGVIGCFNKKAG